eukprot:CAMPEP_0114263814 /NCGR_PEP_ID=MMETSP0058-20121206/22780_1 /TAXON_ID=36894 /ORGANISM="Pyramimonas parkeae, CCMP726" /LENGTH=112 /DNA_ID=CAMNT_0001380259 /DNA_START=293 /DNA_END=628 /DNA_ORIENTATION=+
MYPGGAYRVSIGLFLQLLVINALEIAPGPSSWDEKLTYLETSLNDMTFINQLEGFAVGDFGVIMQSWSKVPQGSSNAYGSSVHWQSISCSDELHCWVVGTRYAVVLTVDGGQ